MSNKTAEGLRDRLFNALDGLIEKRIETKEVEAICYLSEQIIKTAQTELEISREMNRAGELERQHQLLMKREEKEAIKMLGNTMEAIIDEES